VPQADNATTIEAEEAPNTHRHKLSTACLPVDPEHSSGSLG